MKRNCAQKSVDPPRTFQFCFQGFQRVSLRDGIFSVGCLNQLRDFLEVVKGHLKSLRNENTGKPALQTYCNYLQTKLCFALAVCVVDTTLTDKVVFVALLQNSMEFNLSHVPQS